MSLKQQSRELKVTMVVNSRTLELMSCVMNLELDINSRPSTLHNQIVSPQPIYNLSSPFVLIVDKGGEKFTNIVR